MRVGRSPNGWDWEVRRFTLFREGNFPKRGWDFGSFERGGGYLCVVLQIFHSC
jgi:hypothetical protein